MRTGRENDAQDREPSSRRLWHRAAEACLSVAIVAVLAALVDRRGDDGDSVVGIYFALLALVLFVRGLRVRPARDPEAPMDPRWLVGLALAAVVGASLVVADLATVGRM